MLNKLSGFVNKLIVNIADERGIPTYRKVSVSLGKEGALNQYEETLTIRGVTTVRLWSDETDDVVLIRKIREEVATLTGSDLDAAKKLLGKYSIS